MAKERLPQSESGAWRCDWIVFAQSEPGGGGTVIESRRGGKDFVSSFWRKSPRLGATAGTLDHGGWLTRNLD